MKPVPALIWLSLALLTAGGASPPPSPDIRPVRTIVATRSTDGETVSLTGHIRARTEESLAFRIDGRMIARRVDVGVVVKPGDFVGELDPLPQQDACAPRKPNLSRRRQSLTKPPTTERQRYAGGAKAGPPESSSTRRRGRYRSATPTSMPAQLCFILHKTSSATRSCWHMVRRRDRHRRRSRRGRPSRPDDRHGRAR